MSTKVRYINYSWKVFFISLQFGVLVWVITLHQNLDSINTADLKKIKSCITMASWTTVGFLSITSEPAFLRDSVTDMFCLDS